MHWLQPVTRVGQRPVHDGRQSIGQVALPDRSAEWLRKVAGVVFGVEIIVAHAGRDTVAFRAQQATLWESFPHFPFGEVGESGILGNVAKLRATGLPLRWLLIG